MSIMKEKYPAHTRIMRTTTAAIIAGLLAFPGTAFAADAVYVGSDEYTAAASGSGSSGGTWSWDGADDMQLDNYNGENIASVGTLNVELVGDNKVEIDYGPASGSSTAYGMYVTPGSESDSTLTVTGGGSLSFVGDGTGSANDDKDTLAAGIFGAGSNVVIDGTRVNVDYSDSGYEMQEGITTTGDGNITIMNGSRVIVNALGDTSYSRGRTFGTGIDTWGGEGKLTIIDSTVESRADGGYALYGASTAEDSVYIKNSDIIAEGAEHAIYSNGGMMLINSDINALARPLVREGAIEAEAEAGASQGAAIAARTGITMQNVSLVGATVAVDQDGIYYVVNADGSTGSVTAKHTGAASKFVNGVGRDKTPMSGSSVSSGTSGSAVNSATDGAAVRTASTGGGITQMVADALSHTFDSTTFTPAVVTMFSAVTAFFAAAVVSKRHKFQEE